ncbi:hypothetical protein BKA61DRAFT_576518 [Leptodontidium sp. MPI-SDFR-AT-0119]|nr:hypothetical protein BKA61DRAFT_576518 [Leptodontidium sp. MPI-SDFR-AT-0119]
MLFTILPRAAAMRCSFKTPIRSISTLQSNPHIYVFPSSTPSSHILTLLPTQPPTPSLAIGTTTALPPTPSSVTENPHFMRILYDVLRLHAPSDPFVQGQAAAFASSSGSSLGSGGMFFPQQKQRRGGGSEAAKRGHAGDGAGGASSQGGAGGGGRGGWIHVSDLRAPPDYGRIAWPEDIFGSLEVDGRGEFVVSDGEEQGRGNWMVSGSYRVITREGILGLSDFLRGKLVERLMEEEEKVLK